MKGVDMGDRVQIGPGFWQLLVLMFVYLKLTGQTDLSWWWLSPLLVVMPAQGLFIYFSRKVMAEADEKIEAARRAKVRGESRVN